MMMRYFFDEKMSGNIAISVKQADCEAELVVYFSLLIKCLFFSVKILIIPQTAVLSTS